MSEPIQNRYDFSILFDVKNGNPNGDPDAGNMPRLDPQTEHGLVTDVAIKRKVRDHVLAVKNGQPPYAIYIQSDNILGNCDAKAQEERPEGMTTAQYMCQQYYDIRTFGAVMASLAKNHEKNGPSRVRGPVQLGFAESIDPIVPREIAITRVAKATEERKKASDTEMGRKFIVPYGLYRANGFINAKLAEQTGFSQDDLDLFWNALLNMFELDHSAARGEMAVRKLYVFKHDNELGDTQSYKLFDTIHVSRKDGVDVPRHFSDYEVTVDKDAIAPRVELTEKVEDGMVHPAQTAQQ